MIAERFHFHRRNQAPEESVADFVAQLKRLSTHCQFGEHLNEALRDHFVCGLKSEVMQKRLLSEVYLTLKRAIEIVQGIEAAEQHAQQLKAEAVIRKVSPQSTTRSAQGTRTMICNHCGKSNHKSSQCHYKDVICNNCKKKGHLAKICRAPKQTMETGVAKKKLQRHRGANWIDTGQPESDTDSELPLFKIQDSTKSIHPIKVDMEINGKILSMEVDTGAAVSIISQTTWQKLFSKVPIKPASLRLRTYTGEPMKVEGEMITQVKYGSQLKELGLIVVQGDGPSLFGHNWLDLPT